MSTALIDFRPFVEWDNNPFILFDPKGKILYLNNSAEILLGYVSKKELFDLALAYAPQSFGYKTTSISLRYEAFNFYSITVGYENEEQLSIRFYNAPRLRNHTPVEKEKLTLTDINLLLEANIALFKTKNSNPLQLLTDPDMPQLRIDQNRFSKLLRKVFESFRASDSIRIELKLLVGEHVIIDEQKISIAQLSTTANGRYVDNDKEIKILSEECNIRSNLQESSIKLEIPLIT